MNKRIRWAVAALAAVLLVGLTLSVPPAPAPPAHATTVAGETWRTDDWIEAPYAQSWQSTGDTWHDQGYTRKRPSYFQHTSEPDCALGIGRSPASGSHVATNVEVKNGGAVVRTPANHWAYIDAADGTEWGTDYTYWVHAQRDDTADFGTICRATQVTTDSNGYFTVTFPRTLSATPSAVVWSAAGPTGVNSPINNMVYDGSVSSSGFTGRAWRHDNVAIANVTLTIDYWAKVSSSWSGTDAQGQAYYGRAGVATVTTDASGNATIDYSDFTGGEHPAGGNATAESVSGQTSNFAGGIVVTAISDSAMYLHVRKEWGSVLANATFDVHYIAEGNEGGSVHPWGTLGYRQLGPPVDEETRCNGDTIPCHKWGDAESSVSLEYGLDSFFSALPNVGGSTVISLMDAAFTDWNGADVDIPTLVKDATPDGDEKIFVSAFTWATGVCGKTVVYYPTANNRGTKGISSTLLLINDDSQTSWYKVNQGDGLCPVEHAYRHEIGHTLGIGHADSTDSLMYAYVTNPDHASLSTADRDHARAMYGYSGSLYGKNFKVSNLFEARKGASSGLVTVTGIGETKADRWGKPITEVKVAPASWNGRVPTSVWVMAGELDGVTAGPVNMKVGRRYVVSVNDQDRVVLTSLRVKGNTVYLTDDLWVPGVDDVDGGSKTVVALDKLKAKAA